jgi:DNA-binding Lrp family transcriptional regulator
VTKHDEHPQAFKYEAACRILDKNERGAAVARSLGLPESTVRRWATLLKQERQGRYSKNREPITPPGVEDSSQQRLMLLSATDRKVLRYVQTNYGTPNEIQKATKVPKKNAVAALQRLKERGILHVVGTVDPDQVGLPVCAMIEIKLKKVNDSVINSYTDRVLKDKTVQQCYFVGSRDYDILMILNVSEIDDINTFIDSRTFRPAYVESYSVRIVMSKLKVGLEVPIPVI